MRKKVLMVLLLLFSSFTLISCGTKADTITVLTSSGYEPYEMVDKSGNLTGFDIELMEALAKEVGIEIKWKDVAFDGIIASLQSGQAQIAIAGISPTDSRKQMVDFSDVYYNSAAGLTNCMIYSNEENYASFDDLDGLIVGAQLGTVQADLIQNNSDEYGFTVDLRNSNTQIVEEIKSGRIDVLIVESAIADSILASTSGLKKAVLDTELNDTIGNAIAFSKGSSFVHQFNAALATLKANGVLEELTTKWFD